MKLVFPSLYANNDLFKLTHVASWLKAAEILAEPVG